MTPVLTALKEWISKSAIIFSFLLSRPYNQLMQQGRASAIAQSLSRRSVNCDKKKVFSPQYLMAG